MRGEPRPASPPRTEHRGREGNVTVSFPWDLPPLPALLAFPSTGQEVDDVEVVFVAGILVHLLVRIDLVPWDQSRPRPGPRRRVFDGELVVERVGGHAGEALGDLEGRRIRVLKNHSIVAPEVARLDDERRTIPVAARIAQPLPERCVEVRATVDRNDAR